MFYESKKFLHCYSVKEKFIWLIESAQQGQYICASPHGFDPDFHHKLTIRWGSNFQQIIFGKQNFIWDMGVLWKSEKWVSWERLERSDAKTYVVGLNGRMLQTNFKIERKIGWKSNQNVFNFVIGCAWDITIAQNVGQISAALLFQRKCFLKSKMYKPSRL